MATIALYSNKINQMSGLIQDVKQSVTDYKSELSALRTKSLNINKSVCNLDDVISSLQTSTRTQEQKIDSLDTFSRNHEKFVSEVVRIDGNIADIVNKRKNDFYNQYNYLKPECEKNGWEKFCDGCTTVRDWCKEHWKSIGKILLTVIVIVALGVATIFTGGIVGVILAGAFWGALSGALIGGTISGFISAINGESFFEGFIDGAFSGVVEGALTGAVFAGAGLAISALKNSKYLTKISKLDNFKKGKAFSDKVGKILGKSAKNEIPINLKNGSKFRADFIKQSKITKKFNIFEAKGSATAKFTKGQISSFAKNGNKLVDIGSFTAKGKTIFGNVPIAKDTIVQVIRPNDILTLGAKVRIAMPAGIFGGIVSNLYSELKK